MFYQRKRFVWNWVSHKFGSLNCDYLSIVRTFFGLRCVCNETSHKANMLWSHLNQTFCRKKKYNMWSRPNIKPTISNFVNKSKIQGPQWWGVASVTLEKIIYTSTVAAVIHEKYIEVFGATNAAFKTSLFRNNHSYFNKPTQNCILHTIQRHSCGKIRHLPEGQTIQTAWGMLKRKYATTATLYCFELWDLFGERLGRNKTWNVLPLCVVAVKISLEIIEKESYIFNWCKLDFFFLPQE